MIIAIAAIVNSSSAERSEIRGRKRGMLLSIDFQLFDAAPFGITALMLMMPTMA